jgi:hypothetical protein
VYQAFLRSIFLYSRLLNFFDVLRLTFHAVFDTLAAEPDKIMESTEHNSRLFGIFFEDCQLKKFYAGSISIHLFEGKVHQFLRCKRTESSAVPSGLYKYVIYGIKEKCFENFPYNITLKQGLFDEQNDATILQRHIHLVYRKLCFLIPGLIQ